MPRKPRTYLSGVPSHVVQYGTPLGNDRFKNQIEAALGRKLGYVTRGRPAKLKVGPDLKLAPVGLGK